MNEIVFDVEKHWNGYLIGISGFHNKCAIKEQGAFMLGISSTWTNWSDRAGSSNKKLRSINSICLMSCKII